MSLRLFGFGPMAVALVSVGLASCGGGGGGGGDAPGGGVVTPPPPPPPTFSSWSNDLKPGATVNVPGKSREITFAGSAGGGSTISAPTALVDTTYTEVVNAAGVITSVKIATPNRTLSFSSAAGDTIASLPADPRILVAANVSGSQAAVAADPIKLGWNYQSFGVWETGDGAGSGSAGAVSIGAATAAAAIPTSGSATFTGVVGGVYLDTSGIDSFVAADMTLAVNFTGRSAAFASNQMTNIVDGTVYAGTNLGGALTYAAGANALSGTLTTGNGRLSGTANGQFFGPAAQEVGGLFFLTPTGGSTSIERLGGGFGAKQ